MYKKIAALIISFIFFISAAGAGETLFVFDGIIWNRIPDNDQGKLIKRYYVQGIYDGAFAMAGTKVKEKYDCRDINHSDIIKLLDHFYKNKKNQKIPVSYAVVISSMELRGAEKKEINKEVIIYRKLFGKLSSESTKRQKK